jgi:hypothetical protein
MPVLRPGTTRPRPADLTAHGHGTGRSARVLTRYRTGGATRPMGSMRSPIPDLADLAVASQRYARPLGDGVPVDA